ncbi:hypothetical protein [Treponema sp. UBA3813]|uniref:hypothetical protein n=1 Tax=Treponema sp. UBA3813 TaxID=1947715 RepID=UPI0025F97F49|nr:hypothetical protein [Treponema sp. UBA3813]
MDYRIPDPNKKITDKLVLDFARKSSDEDKNNSLTVLRDNGDTYTVLVTDKDEKTGEVTQREETISREAFEAAVKKGYLEKQ